MKFTINGSDAYANYGVFISNYEGIVSQAPLKKPASNDWPDSDGVEVDLIDPKLDTHSFSIDFGCIDKSLADDFIESITIGVYHTFVFTDLGVTRKLRLIDESKNKTGINLRLFTLAFSDDNPLNGYTYQAPLNYGVSQIYELNTIKISDYGVWVLDGSDDEIVRSPNSKKNLTTDIASSKGVIYDDRDVWFKDKVVSVKCFMQAPDMVTFWRNYNALLYNLIQGEVQLYDGVTLIECYYKSIDCTKFVLEKLWCEFTLNLVFIDYRPEATIELMGSGLNVITFEGEGVLIKPKVPNTGTGFPYTFPFKLAGSGFPYIFPFKLS